MVSARRRKKPRAGASKKRTAKINEIRELTVEIQNLKSSTSFLKSELRRLFEISKVLESQISSASDHFEKRIQTIVENNSYLESRLEEVRISTERLSRDLDKLLEARPAARKITMPPPITAQLTIYDGEEPLAFQVGVVPGVVESVIESARSHVNQSGKPDEEIVGVLIGRVVGKTVVVEEAVLGKTSYSGLTEVAIDPKNLAEIIDRMMKEDSSRRVVGWYHSHLGIGVFLSDVDIRTQLMLQQFRYVIALVVDPIKNDYGFFYVDRESKLPDGRPNVVRFIKKE
jgi:proteasome lid subunit RPN8/RPN11